MNKFLLVVPAAFILLTGASCNLYHALGGRWKDKQAAPVATSIDTSSRVEDTVNSKPEVAEKPVSILPEEQAALTAWLPIWQRQTSFTSFSTKAKAHFEGKGEDHDFTANIRIVKGQKIWVSITALGLVEIARALITPDTIMAIDRLHRTAYILPFSEADKLLPFSIDFLGLQSLLLGDVLSNGQNPNQFSDSNQVVSLSFSDGTNAQKVVLRKVDSALINQYFVSPNTQVAATYSDFGIIDGRRIAQSRLLHIQNAGALQTLQMNYEKVEFDKDIQMNFSIPSRYERK